MSLTLLFQRMRYFYLQGQLFRVAISLNLIPFAAGEVGHEDRFAAILDGSGGQVTDAGPLGGIVNIHVERLAVS